MPHLPSLAARGKRPATSRPQEAPLQEAAPDDVTQEHPVVGVPNAGPDAPAGAKAPNAAQTAVADPSLIGVELLDGSDDGTIIPCAQPFVIVGRDPKRDDEKAKLSKEQQERVTLVAITSDPKLSRTHLLLSYREGAWYVRDLDSTNGTHLGAKRDKLGKEEQPIAIGQLLRAGNSHLRLVAIPAHATQPGDGAA